MKTLLLIFVALSAASVSEASRARLQALGQSGNGSLYIEDTRSVFLNPAFLHSQTSFANFEFGDTTVPSSPQAEGGLIRSTPDMKIGVQLGRQGVAASQIADINSRMALDLIYPQNSVEVLFAGGMATKWGASILYGNSEDLAETTGTPAFPNKKASTVELRGGLMADMWDGYVSLSLASRSENEISSGNIRKYEGRPTITLGGAYDLAQDQKLIVNLSMVGYTGRAAGATSDREATQSVASVGWVQFLSPEASTRIFYSGALAIDNYKLTNIGGASETKIEQMYIPIIVGLESNVSDWLDLRAAVNQRVLLDQRKTTVTDISNPNTTTVSAGAGIKWKKVVIDGTLSGATTGAINGNSLLANAGMTYQF